MIFKADKTKEINGEKLFMESYKISPYFKFNYRGNCLGIVLEITKLPKHYIYYLIELIKII